MSSVKIFSGTNSIYLAEKIAEHYGTTLGKLTVDRFSDGEISPWFNESIRGGDLYLVQGTFPPAENLLELLLMVDAAKRASAKSVTIVVPYFGYARQDRKDKPRVAIGAKLVANLMSAAKADRLMTLDLHAGQIQGFFDIPVDHLDGSAIFMPYLESLNLEKLVIASPDTGGLVRARRYAKYLKSGLAVCYKERIKANEIASMDIIGDVENANVVLIDDLIDTGGTITKAADLIMQKGAKSVRAICSHPVLSGDAYQKINHSVLTELVVTDTIPIKNTLQGKIRVLSVSGLFADAIKRVHEEQSISSLFI
jgi:ribose-phosphate pyrophosphokinase